ncbi:MAG: histidinol-phosphate transaminase [Porticoccaceae bacterium]|jgi:histidinol-phosphate aminotransferase|nr:histidinol-phosphate transaminase [Porticoccaceae bacterium]|tara:strand:+ start:2633 stop:3694 length:1062 start_codon:yes stop_codon:yes gene_type:complete
MEKYWSDLVKQLRPYEPGEQPWMDGVLKLNTNENPFGPSPKVLSAIEGQLGNQLRLYPPPNADLLKQAIADYYGLKDSQIFLGNGSDEILAHVFNGLLKKALPLLFPDITYSFYPVFCQLYDIDFEEIPLKDDLSIDLTDYEVPNGGIIFPNPNAPTGRLLAIGEIEYLLKANRNSVVVIDEAYIDFGGQSSIGLLTDNPNLIVTQTMSKSRSMAGMRIGFALGSADLIEGLERVKNSFNSYPLGHLQIAAGISAIEDSDHFKDTCQRVIHNRAKLTIDLEELGFSVVPSAGNFVLVRHFRASALKIYGQLKNNGILVRHFNKQRLDNFLRITVGTTEQNDQLVAALATILRS